MVFSAPISPPSPGKSVVREVVSLGFFDILFSSFSPLRGVEGGKKSNLQNKKKRKSIRRVDTPLDPPSPPSVMGAEGGEISPLNYLHPVPRPFVPQTLLQSIYF